MEGSLVFVHGTGVREGLKDTLEKVCAGVKTLPQSPISVVGPEWGKEIGPADLDVTPVLPASSAQTRAAAGGEAPGDVTDVATWGLLIDDPLLELRMLAAAPSARTGLVVNARTVAVELQQLLSDAEVAPEALEAAGVEVDEMRSALAFVRGSEALVDAAGAVGDAGIAGLLGAVSRSVVACVLHAHRTARPPRLSPVALSGEQRTKLVGAVGEAVSGTPTRGIFTQTIGKALGPLAVRIGNSAVRENRAKLMDPFSDFIRDVAFYIRRGEDVRTFLATAISDLPANGPVVVVGHSLGGIAMVDLMSGADAPHVDLLVTVGSQAPYLYLLDSLVSLRPGPGSKPFTPWLNIYSPADFLSFRAAPAFPDVGGIVDEEVDAGVPFPESHSAYWSHKETYDLIGKNWP
ncbi:hypothetical protein MBT42_33500 [Streptomyces sp. MBT42]|uniref:hypothetical protein n=1 Tax=Streptomyces sp. MBT42 TaxID=1488373 RepID=UPI001E2AA3EF|nr:hypothetical protein [Streptomyces sp. MBT42]MCD2468451.1 hypothetical protein [Streptomyces sp. MBT42]